MNQAAPVRPKALVVDDDPFLRLDVIGILEEAGFHAHEASDSDAAIRSLEAQAAEIVLLFTDVQMAGSMNGFALARQTAERWLHVSIVVASGQFSPGPGELPAGADFINKPFNGEIVRAHLQRILPDNQKPEPLKG